MTDKIIISRKEIEELFAKYDMGRLSLSVIDDIRALLDKAEGVSCEAVGEIKIYWGSDTGYEYGLTLIGGALGSQKEYDEWIVKNFNGEGVFKLYTTPQPSRIKEIEALQAREKDLVEALERTLETMMEAANEITSLRAELEKAEGVSEPIGELVALPIYNETGIAGWDAGVRLDIYFTFEAGMQGAKVYTTPQPSRISELEAEIERLKAIIGDMNVIDNVFWKGK